jgi:hypothetical protein
VIHTNTSAPRRRTPVIGTAGEHIPTDHDMHVYKATQLLHERLVTHSTILPCAAPSDSEFLVRALVALQATIFDLDLFGETVWDISHGELDRFWHPIYETLSAAGVSPSLRAHLLTELTAYQNVELDLRKGRLPLSIPLWDYYRLKSCDVRLARNTLANTAGPAVLDGLQPLFECLDVAMEVCDDLLDVREDSTTYNCNRIFLECCYNGAHDVGVRYMDFLFCIRNEAIARFSTPASSSCKSSEYVLHKTLESVATAVRHLIPALTYIHHNWSSSTLFLQRCSHFDTTLAE